MKYAAMLAILGLSFLSAVQVSNAQTDVPAVVATTEVQVSLSHIDLMLPVATPRMMSTHSI